MLDKEMIRYQHPKDTNTWFVQSKDDAIPEWAVNLEKFNHNTLEPDKGYRCDRCSFAKLKEYGYSAYTVEGITFSCVIEKHPSGSFDKWYGEDKRLMYANKCSNYSYGKPIKIGVDGNLM